MKIQTFEDIIAWQKSKDFALAVYKFFSVCKDFSFKNQIERASISIMNNIAEGFERQTNKELKNFLFISKGSCAEVRSMLIIAVDLNYIPKEQSAVLVQQSLEISRMLSNFIKKL